MQYINLNKTIDINDEILDLLLISIDDQIESIEEKDGINLIGDIIIGGKVKTKAEEKEFNDKIGFDSFLTFEEIANRESLNVSINDFTYTIEGSKLLLNISLKIEGLKEIETTFLAEENTKDIQEEIEYFEEFDEKDNNIEYSDDIEIQEDRESSGEDQELGREENECENIIEEEKIEETINIECKKSLLKSVFSNRKINEEISWKLHCVKGEKTYEEIAEKYNVNLKDLISMNNKEPIEDGKLVFLPIK
jgi:hypothetical protein